nr:hypothetical protein StreXyl84_59090 [Streptomyces sp. Xyl84]
MCSGGPGERHPANRARRAAVPPGSYLPPGVRPATGPAVNRRERGACRFDDPERFFPSGEGVWPPRRIRQARAVCSRRPVPRECRACAVRHGEYDGARGGATAGERRAAARGSGGDGGR